MENESLMISALQKGVVAAVAQSNEPTLPVKYLLKSFAVPQSQKWLEVIWIPNNVQGMFRGQETQHRGILRLVLHWPKDGSAVYAPVQLLASITEYFTNGRLLSGVQIYGKPMPTGVVEDGDDTLFPVSIYYQSFRKGA